MILYLALLLLAQPPATGSVTGEVRLEATASSQGQRGARNRYGSGTARSGTPAADTPVLVWVELDGSQRNAAMDESPVMDQRDLQFSPRLIAVREGQAVRFRNSDPVYHNVFSLSDVKKFNIGRRPRGEIVEVTFGRAGVVQVFCDIHASMNAVIRVLPASTVRHTVVTPGGRFRLDDLPAGTYRLKAFAPGRAEWSGSIRVEAGRPADAGAITLTSD